MAKYIDRDALMAGIEKRIFEDYNSGDEEMEEVDEAVKGALASLRYFINNLEVKEVEESTADDRGVAEEIIINLKRVEQDYHIDLTNEMEWIRNKSQKGGIV